MAFGNYSLKSGLVGHGKYFLHQLLLVGILYQPKHPFFLQLDNTTSYIDPSYIQLQFSKVPELQLAGFPDLISTQESNSLLIRCFASEQLMQNSIIIIYYRLY